MIKIRNISNRTLDINNESVEAGKSIFIDDNITGSTAINQIKEYERLNLINVFYNVTMPVKQTVKEESNAEEQSKSKSKKK